MYNGSITTGRLLARLQIATLGFRLTSTRFAACDLMASLIAGENVGSTPTVLNRTIMFLAARAVAGANPLKAQGGCGVQFPSGSPK